MRSFTVTRSHVGPSLDTVARRGRVLGLAAEQLRHLRTRRGSKPRKEAVDEKLVLGNGEPRVVRNIRSDANGLSKLGVRRRQHRIGRNLPLPNGNGMTRTALVVGMRNLDDEIAVVGPKRAGVQPESSPLKGLGNRVDGNRFGIGECHGGELFLLERSRSRRIRPSGGATTLCCRADLGTSPRLQESRAVSYLGTHRRFQIRMD